MFRPKAIFLKVKNPSPEFLYRIFEAIQKGIAETVPAGLWVEDDISLMDYRYTELISGYQKYFVLGSEVEGEVSIDDFSMKYAPLTPENYSLGKVIKTIPEVTREKLEAMTVTILKDFVKAGSEKLNDAIDLRLKKADMIDAILKFFGKGEIEDDTTND